MLKKEFDEQQDTIKLRDWFWKIMDELISSDDFKKFFKIVINNDKRYNSKYFLSILEKIKSWKSIIEKEKEDILSLLWNEKIIFKAKKILNKLKWFTLEKFQNFISNYPVEKIIDSLRSEIQDDMYDTLKWWNKDIISKLQLQTEKKIIFIELLDAKYGAWRAQLENWSIIIFKQNKLIKEIWWKKIVDCYNINIRTNWTLVWKVKLEDWMMIPFIWDKLIEEIWWKKIINCWNIHNKKDWILKWVVELEDHKMFPFEGDKLIEEIWWKKIINCFCINTLTYWIALWEVELEDWIYYFKEFYNFEWNNLINKVKFIKKTNSIKK